VRLALDDFGTGYSSLAYLRRFPMDILKIDQAFVAPITIDPMAAALIRSIIDMAHTLGLSTVAEGVETAEQAELLTEMGCRYAQGFHFAMPASADVISHGLRKRGGLARTR
jgi:EAL domain-containing protein (putative c-di-GMP-specific phosphodiesterase class I)